MIITNAIKKLYGTNLLTSKQVGGRSREDDFLQSQFKFSNQL